MLFQATLGKLMEARIALDAASAQALQERALHLLGDLDRFVAPPELGRQREQLSGLCAATLGNLSRCGA